MTRYYWMPPGIFVNPFTVGVVFSGAELASEKVEVSLATPPLFAYKRTMQRDFVSHLPPLVRRIF